MVFIWVYFDKSFGFAVSIRVFDELNILIRNKHRDPSRRSHHFTIQDGVLRAESVPIARTSNVRRGRLSACAPPPLLRPAVEARSGLAPGRSVVFPHTRAGPFGRPSKAFESRASERAVVRCVRYGKWNGTLPGGTVSRRIR